MKKPLVLALALVALSMSHLAFAANGKLLAEVTIQDTEAPEGSGAKLFKLKTGCLIEVDDYFETGSQKTAYYFSKNKLLSAQITTTTYSNPIFVTPDDEDYDATGQDVDQKQALNPSDAQVRRAFQKVKGYFSGAQLSRCRS